jgi:hypothetical protein
VAIKASGELLFDGNYYYYHIFKININMLFSGMICAGTAFLNAPGIQYPVLLVQPQSNGNDLPAELTSPGYQVNIQTLDFGSETFTVTLVNRMINNDGLPALTVLGAVEYANAEIINYGYASFTSVSVAAVIFSDSICYDPF